MREESGPVVPGPEVSPLRKSLTPIILGPLLPMPVVGQAEEERRERLLLIRPGFSTGRSLEELLLQREQPIEGGEGELPGIPRMVGLRLRVAHVGHRGRGK